MRGLCCCCVNEGSSGIPVQKLASGGARGCTPSMDESLPDMHAKACSGLGLGPEAWEPLSVEAWHYPPEKWQIWAAAATKWRWLLRTSQSLMAMCLYGGSTFLRMPGRAVGLQFVLALLVSPLFSFVYHLLSLNRAGSYYNTYLEMFTQLPRLLLVMGRRDAHNYHAEIMNERREGVVRTVNGLESAVIFILVNWATLAASAMCSTGTLAGDNRWRCIETAVFFLFHRGLGANVLRGRCAGLLQPESMWQFESDPESMECHMRPLTAHPQPPY